MPDTPALSIPGNAPAAARPDFKRPEYVDLEPSRRLSRAMMGGTRAVRALGTEALPKWPAEEPAFYRLRAKIAQVTRYTARTVEAVVGMVVGTPPTLAEGTDARIMADAEDIDRRGTHLDVFARDLTQEAIVGGLAGILVDAPPVPDGLRLTLANEQRMGIRPYWVLVTAEQLVSWVTESPDWARIMADYASGALRDEDVARLSTQQIVRQVVIAEVTNVRAGEFGVVARDRYRVLMLTDQGVRFRVWEHVPAVDGAAEHFRMVNEGAMLGAGRRELPAIPLAIAYPKRPSAPFVSEPAVLGVAELNLDHYQLTADRRYLLKHTHSPTLYLFGVDAERDETGQEKPIRVGPNSVIRSRNADAKIGYAAAAPDALEASKEERDEIVRQIAALGMSFLAKDRQSGGTETAKGRGLDLAAENATHATIARGVQDALEQALMFHGLYRDCPAPSVEMHTAYAAPEVDAQMAGVLWQAVIADKLDVDTWLTFLRTGKVPESFNYAEYAADLAAAGAADQEAEDEAARQLLGDGEGDTGDNQPAAA
ncbi:MAG: DUF4055 domain-containing protein [Gemmatimonas sp.]|nr:DUF4055 domain-containing protein [Gemmatimonas sp.]